MWQSPCPACSPPAPAGAGPIGLRATGVPPRRKGQTARVCCGRQGKEAGLNLRKCSPATRQLPKDQAGAPSPALFGVSSWCRQCQALPAGTRSWLQLVTPLGCQLLWRSSHREGDSPARDGHCIQAGHSKSGLHPTARPGLQAMPGTGWERGWEGQLLAGRWLPKTLGRDCGEPRSPSAAGAALPLWAVNRLSLPAAKTFHPPRVKVSSPTGSGVAGGVTDFHCWEGWMSSV